MSEQPKDRPALQTAILAFFVARTAVSILIFVGGLALLAVIIVVIVATGAMLQVTHPLPR